MAGIIPYTHTALYDVKLTEQEMNVIIIVLQNAMAKGAVPRAWHAKVTRIQELLMNLLDEAIGEEEAQ